MNILLIIPHLGVKRNWMYRISIYHANTIEQIAAITPDKHTVTLLDEIYDEIDYDAQFDVVGISCLTCNAVRGYEIADEFRKRGVPVVLGGYHPSALPDEAKQHADSVVIGEAEFTWPQLLDDLEHKRLQPFYKATHFFDPALIPPPKRVMRKQYTSESVQATRGCPTQCKFCAITKGDGPVFRPRPIKNVIDEIKSIKNNTLIFIDASLTIDPSYTKALFREMIGLGKKFECLGNLNVLARDDELLQLAHDAGCFLWFVGVESISQETIESIGKKTNKVEEYNKAIDKIKKHGMMVTGSFVFGFDTDTKDVFKTTLQAIEKMGLDSVSFSILTPYPGTNLYNEFEKEGRLMDKDWSKYTEGYVVFKPKQMTGEELLQGYHWMQKKYFSYWNMVKLCIHSNHLNFDLFIKKIILNFYLKLFHKEMLGS